MKEWQTQTTSILAIFFLSLLDKKLFFLFALLSKEEEERNFCSKVSECQKVWRRKDEKGLFFAHGGGMALFCFNLRKRTFSHLFALYSKVCIASVRMYAYYSTKRRKRGEPCSYQPSLGILLVLVWWNFLHPTYAYKVLGQLVDLEVYALRKLWPPQWSSLRPNNYSITLWVRRYIFILGKKPMHPSLLPPSPAIGQFTSSQFLSGERACYVLYCTVVLYLRI